MANKEELNRIFEKALQAEEAVKNFTPAITPVAAPSMPVVESVQTQPEAASATAEPINTAEKVADVSVNVSDPEFGALLEEREGRLKKRSSQARWAVNLLVVGILGGTAAAFAVSPTLRGKVDHLVVSLNEGVDDVKMMGKGSENYDEALEEVAARGDQIDAAARAMGIDPTTVDPGDDPNMLAEMNELAGEDIGIDTRLGKLQGMGKVGQAITGAEGPKTEDDFAAAAQDAAEAPSL